MFLSGVAVEIQREWSSLFLRSLVVEFAFMKNIGQGTGNHFQYSFK
jgi:hypothetical protein